MRRRVVGLTVVALTAAAGCGSDAPESVEGVTVSDGFEVTEVAVGLTGPTQIVRAPDGRLLAAHLNGGEGSTDGQVLAIDDEGESSVLFDGLRKPTGLAVVDDEVWVMEERRLSRGPLDGGELEVVLDELPYNGRSEGTLTATPDDRLLYNTSGTVRDDAAADGSATLWVLGPDGEPAPVATGFKHAYARTYDDADTLWQTEMSDGRYDGEPAPDELVAVEPGDDFGWPRCIGDRQPVAEFDGTADGCAETPRSHALFEPGATPTSVAVAPWDPETLLVALWNRGQVVELPRDGERPVEAEPFLTGIEHPQHLLADGERLLVVDFDGGRILSVHRSD